MKIKKLSEEHKKNIGLSKKGNKYMLGHKHSEEAKKKISKANKGRKLSEETKKKMSEAKKGNKNALGYNQSEKSKKQISESMKGKKNSLGKKNALGYRHSDKTKKRLSEKGKIRIREKSCNWKGGITAIQILVRNSIKYQQWRCNVFERDNYICQFCNLKGGKLNAHHIIEFKKIIDENKIKTLEEAEICEELWNINNGITLCEKCHKKIHKKESNNK